MGDALAELESAIGGKGFRTYPDAARQISTLGVRAPTANFRKLRHVVRRHRLVILRRGAVIAVSTVLAVGAALLLHAAFAGLFLLSILFPAAPVRGDGKSMVGAPDAGGAPIALPASLDEPSPAARAASGVPGAVTATPAAIALPDLPLQMPAVDPAVASSVPLIPMPDPLGSVALPAPSAIVHPPMPPAPSAPTSPAASAGGTSRHPSDAPIDVARGGFADEPMLALTKGGGDGAGNGRGNGFGNGIDRGLSAADRAAQPINPTSGDNEFVPPLKYQMHPPEKPVDLLLTILADGSIGDVSIEQSCGVPELDKMVCDFVRASMRFSPAYHDGKAVTSTFEYGHSFRPFE